MADVMLEKVNYLELLPHEFRARIAAAPIGYVPLGTLEWHGEQCALGSDALIAQGVFMRAARRFGGIVFPPLFMGPDEIRLQPDGSYLTGMEFYPQTDPNRQLDGSCYWISEGLFMALSEGILAQAKRAGFEVMVASGHAPSHILWGEKAEGWEKQFGLKLIIPYRDLRKSWRSQIDHAGRNETSLMMALWPDHVSLEQLDPDRSVWPQGVMWEDPRDSTVAYGEECIAASLDALAPLLALPSTG